MSSCWFLTTGQGETGQVEPGENTSKKRVKETVPRHLHLQTSVNTASEGMKSKHKKSKWKNS